MMGAPDRFTSWRPEQADAWSRYTDSRKRFNAFGMPTGSGKSLLAWMCAKHTEPLRAVTARMSLIVRKGVDPEWLSRLPYPKPRTLILTATKSLQDQYCVAPETKVLRKDLRWVRIDSLQAGDGIVAFDEERQGMRRMWQEATVEAVAPITRPCYRLTFDDGTTVVSSSEHRWLVQYGVRWETTEQLSAAGKRASNIVRLLDTWDTAVDRDAGYLAAAFDGEGWLGQRDPARGNGADVNLAMAQKDNEMLAEVCAALDRRSIGYTVSTATDCHRLQISQRRDVLRFLGEMRPARLLPKLRLDRMGMMGPIRHVKLVKKEFIGEQTVIAMRTSTGTFLAEGLASHNCRDFPIFDIRGQQNYECVAVQQGGPLQSYGERRKTMVDKAPCHAGVHCKLKATGGCLYYDDVAAARNAEVVITNYSYWMALGRMIRRDKVDEPLGKFDLIILDEAHAADTEVCKALRIELPHHDVRTLLSMRPLSPDAPVDEWRDWGREAFSKCGEQLDDYQQQIRFDPDLVDQQLVSELKQLRNLSTTCDQLTELEGDWVIGLTKKDSATTFDPVWPGPYCEELLYRGTPKVILISATIRQKTMQILGIDPDESEFTEYPSSFPVANRPVYIVPCCPRVDKNMKYGSTEERAWINKIDQILDKRRDRKTLIHSVSYERAYRIKALSHHHTDILTHSRENTQQTIRTYREGPPSSILASPSVTTGEDFAFRHCETNIIAKLPFVDMRDPVLRRREQSDKEYGGYQMIQTLVQAAGRSTRDARDRSETFITDDHARWVFSRTGPRSLRRFAPQWFLDALKWPSAIPDPPPPL